jgi:hypothetical protein
MLPPPMRAHLQLLAWAVLLGHVGLVVLRLPTTVIGRRFAQVGAFHSEGQAHYLFRTSGRDGVAAVDELLRSTPADAIVAWRGEAHGAIELAPALLWPRLLVAERALPPDAATFLGRPVARLPDGRQRVLLAEGRALRLVPQ